MKTLSLRPTILAVDDDLEDLELIEETISDLEPTANFKKLTDGSQVLPFLDQYADGELPCLIILDYNMPGMNGAQVVSQLCAIPRYEPIPKIILSTSNANSHIRECMDNGALKYFVKPNNIKDMNRLAEEMLSYCR
ncbi:MAG TPA: response regulator [Chitinophagaceae bacterium]|nr:response regulator [Chitinophagaceae bacterium]